MRLISKYKHDYRSLLVELSRSAKFHEHIALGAMREFKPPYHIKTRHQRRFLQVFETLISDLSLKYIYEFQL